MQATIQERKHETPPPVPDQPSSTRSRRRITLRPEEGWSTFILLGFVLYSAVWSIQVVNWVNGLHILTWTTGAGLVLGLIAAKQRHLPRLAIHAIMMVAGVLLAFWQTAMAAYGGSISSLGNHFVRWLDKAVTPNAETNDDVMFLLFLAVLSFILAYVSVWLVVRTRRPWLVALATAIVLLINLSYAPNGNLAYLVIFLLASLLLLVRFNLVEAYRQWRRRSLRYTPDLGWDFMVAGMLFSIGILILSWLLPTGGTNATVSRIWTDASNPWVSAQQLWARLFQVRAGPGSGAYFSNRLQLVGDVDLPNQVILTYTSQQGDQYLVAVTQDTFDGHTWTSSAMHPESVDANERMDLEAQATRMIRQDIHLVNPPAGSPSQYIFAADQPVQFSLPITAIRDDSGGYIAWTSRQPLVPNLKYTAYSSISIATEQQLRQVPLPDQALDSTNPLYYYPPSILERYLTIPADLQYDEQVRKMARSWTSGATSMYDMALQLENHLRTEYRYNQHNDPPPADQDAVAWFLKDERQGFCTFFASAMVMMARMLGIPARVASGYTNGTYDRDAGQWVVRGTDAHTWAQLYFAGYGWINFEPSPGFNAFLRPLPSQTPGASETPDTGDGTPQAHPTPKDRDQGGVTPGTDTTPSGQQNVVGTRLLLGAGSTLAVVLLLLGATSLWWRRLFRGLSPVAQTFGRVTLLASWAGMKPKQTQTPFEYVEELQRRFPAQAEPLQRLGELYVVERWGTPGERGGLHEELTQLWVRLRGGLVRAVLRRRTGRR